MQGGYFSGGQQRTEHAPQGGWGTAACSFAHVDPLGDAALLAQHVAAPVEAAVAALTACLPQDVVTAPAAQRAAALHSGAALVADAPLSAQRVQGRLPLTEVGRLLEVDQLPGDWPSASPFCSRSRSPPGTGVEHTIVLVLGVYEDGREKLVTEQRPHQPKFWRHVPAGLELAAARRPVALALPLHVVRYYLSVGMQAPDWVKH